MSTINTMIDRAVRCTCCGSQGLGTCECWTRYGPSFKRKRGQQLYKCKHGCFQCSLHCKHAGKKAA